MRGPELGVQADDIEAPEMEQEPKQEVLENKDVGPKLQELRFSHFYLDVLNISNAVCLLFVFQVVVQRVHIDGLGRTKEDLLTYEIAEVFQARNLIDVSACTGSSTY